MITKRLNSRVSSHVEKRVSENLTYKDNKYNLHSLEKRGSMDRVERVRGDQILEEVSQHPRMPLLRRSRTTFLFLNLVTLFDLPRRVTAVVEYIPEGLLRVSFVSNMSTILDILDLKSSQVPSNLPQSDNVEESFL